MKINKDYLFGERELKMMSLSKMTPIGITIHNTYNFAPAINEAKNQFNNNTKKGVNGVAVHFYVDENEIYQLLPLNYHGWHAGDGAGKGNKQTIAIEICRSRDYESDNYKKAEELTVSLVQKLMKDFGFNSANLYKHQDWSGKKCPHRMLDGSPRTWEQFKGLIVGGGAKPNPKPTPTPNGNAKSYQRPKGTYSENGRFTNTSGKKIYMRQYVPSVTGVYNGGLANGSLVDYQDVYIGNGYVWVGNGTTWIPTGEAVDGKRKGEAWGTFGSNVKPSKSIEQMALEVANGDHGNGHTNRQKSLGVDNATYAKVRAEVNRRV